MRSSPILLALLLAAGLLPAARLPAQPAPADSSATRPPNILFIAVDDLNCALGAYGHPIVKTPNLDRLAARGVVFDWAYSQFPLCNPSRASMLTGRRPDEIGVYDLKTHFRSTVPAVVTLPQYFRQQGYHVARVGKIFHYGVPRDIGTPGFDDPVSWDKAFYPRGRDKDEEKLVTNFTPKRGLGNALAYYANDDKDEQQTDGKVANEAIRLLREYQKGGPFFLAAGFFRPHTPYIAPKKYFDLYPLSSIPAPPDPTESLRDVPEIALRDHPLFLGLNPEQQRLIRRAYFASVSFVDAQIGRLLSALDELGLADNTIVVFWSDHGYLLGEHGQWQKQSLFEESARMPMIAAGPGIARGRHCQGVVELLDVYPTLVEMAGLPARSDLSGRSLVPLLRNPAQPWPYAAFSQVAAGRSIRTTAWRYSEWGDEGKRGLELYDHLHDPLEQHNLAKDPKYRPVRDDLSRRLRAVVTGQPQVRVP
jgi:uncharacterized sulfatase